MKKDWVAEVFSAMRDCGENISIVYGQLAQDPSNGELDWFELPHNEFDGMSGMAHLLRAQGYKVDREPEYRGAPLTGWRGLRGVLTALPSLGIRPRQWRRFDAARPARFSPPNERLAWRLFGEEETRQLTVAAKAARVTVNTYLLFHLDRVVAAVLTAPASARRWMIPVNLRGAVTRKNPTAPQMSFLSVDLAGELAPDPVQAQINELKRRAYHWGAWLMLHAGKLMGAEGMRADIRKKEQRGHGWTGIFSNLGVWDIAGSGPWVFCPAISRVHPVGAGCITLNGRMALSMQLHEALCVELDTVYSLLDAWKQACLRDRREAVGDEPAPRVETRVA